MVVYKITNIITNEMYVGQTKKTAEERWKAHLEDIFWNSKLKTNFAEAVRKYGKENFKIEVLEVCSSEVELLEKEQYWIKKLDSINKGYNMTPGGKGNNTYIAKTAEEMKIISSKIAKTKLGSLNPASKKIKAFNIITNETIKFGSLSEAKKYFGMTNHTFISARIHKRIIKPFKNKWLFAYEHEDFISDYENGGRGCNKRISISITDNITKITNKFKTVTEACKYYKTTFGHLNFSSFEKNNNI